MYRTSSKLTPTFLLCASLCFASAAPPPSAEELRQRADEAYDRGDHQTVVRLLEQAVRLDPGFASSRFNLACSYAQLGRSMDAIRELRTLSSQGIDYDLERDTDLTPLRTHESFRVLVLAAKARAGVVVRARTHFTSQQVDLIPEGIAWDGPRKRFFIGSILHHRIYVLDEEGLLYDFATLRLGGQPLFPLGLRVDDKRNLLWVAANPGHERTEARGALIGLDLESGIVRFTLVAPGPATRFNDLVVAPSGDVLATGGTVWRGVPATGALSPVPGASAIRDGNGLVLSNDGTRLFVADYARGLGVIDLPAGLLRWVRAKEIPLLGIDGLYLHRDKLIAVQNALFPWRILELSLDRDATRIKTPRILERANPAARMVMTGALRDDTLYLVGIGTPPPMIPTWVPERRRSNLGPSVILALPLAPLPPRAAVVLLHGCHNGASAQDLDPLARRLRARGIEVHTPELPGHGAAMGRRIEAEGDNQAWMAAWRAQGQPFVNSLVALVQRQAEAPPIVVGAGCGGYFALLLAERHPIRALVTLSGLSDAGQRNLVARSSFPVLGVASSGDGAVPSRVAEIVAAAGGERSSLRTYPGNAHGAAMLHTTPAVLADVADWIEHQR